MVQHFCSVLVLFHQIKLLEFDGIKNLNEF